MRKGARERPIDQLEFEIQLHINFEKRKKKITKMMMKSVCASNTKKKIIIIIKARMNAQIVHRNQPMLPLNIALLNKKNKINFFSSLKFYYNLLVKRIKIEKKA